MSNLKLVATKSDLREAMTLEQKRTFEEERKKRIFNARERIIGIDKQALDQQRAEKERLEQEKVENERKFQEYQKHINAKVYEKEREMQMQKHRIHNQVNDFRAKYQRPEDRREFDLYDPEGKKKDLPARICDTDPRLSVSSAQKFDGEDLASYERKKAQIEQQRAWLEQQMKERREAEQARKNAEEQEMADLIAREQKMIDYERTERLGRMKMLASVTEYNRQLALEQENRRKIKLTQEQEDNLAEQLNHVTSDILTEAPDAEKSNFGPHRIVPYTYRRMNPEQITELKNGQIQQLHERQKIRSEEESIENKWVEMSENYSRTMSLIERDEMRKKKYQLMRLRQENKELAATQHQIREHIDKNVYTNEPTEEYYGMFNTTSR